MLCLPGVMSGKAGSDVITLADKLDRTTPFAASVRYAVTMPMTEDEVVYSIRLASSDNPADLLLGKNYLIDWRLPVAAGESNGFTAYFDGHHYRHHNHRLQENHFQWDSIPFQTSTGGIQRNGQFVNLLPFSIADMLRDMATDTTSTLTIASGILDGRDTDIVKATRHVNGLESQRIELTLDKTTGMPLVFSTIYNPGLLGEQEVNAKYSYPASMEIKAVDSEEALIALYPEVFDKYRVCNYSVENLRGLPLPGFALPTTTRERYLYQKGDSFAHPTIIAVLDPEVASTQTTVATLREAVDKLPRQTGLLLIFNSNNLDLIEPMTGGTRPGEALLTSATPFIRACGINAYPTILFCDTSGTVSGVILGTGSSLADKIIQEAALLK